MSIKVYKPTTAARRQMSIISADGYTVHEPEKSLIVIRKKHSGRNAQGKITVRHKGGGEKRFYRLIDFKRDKFGVPAKVMTLEYDPNRTSFIALLAYGDGEKRYILAPQGLRMGSKIITSEHAPVEVGNRLPLKNIPVGTFVYNIELAGGRGAQLVRSAGSYATVLAQEREYTHLALPSKEVRIISNFSWASVGALSNEEHGVMTYGKAGRMRHMGVRPTVRGTAMNPVDHPHGGGEGRTLTGRRRGPATPWGKPARGVKTRKKRKKSDKYILSKRKK